MKIKISSNCQSLDYNSQQMRSSLIVDSALLARRYTDKLNTVALLHKIVIIVNSEIICLRVSCV